MLHLCNSTWTRTFKDLFHFVLCVQVFCLHISVPCVCLVPKEEVTKSPGVGVTVVTVTVVVSCRVGVKN